MILGLHPVDLTIILVYFALVIYIGVFLGRQRVATLGDFFIAGGNWGPVVSFIFVFASAMGGSEAVVVAAGAYRSGLSGVWYYWHPLFATVVYFLFSTIFKRSRVFNLAEFFEMRYGSRVAAMYAVLGIGAVLLDVGTCQLAVGKIISGMTGLSVDQAVLMASAVAALCVASGGQMSTVLGDLLMGVLVLTVYSFLILPYIWTSAGGFDALRSLPPRVWSLHSSELTPAYILALSFSSGIGSIVSPALFSWIVVGRDEKTATQCAWGHLWKRTITLLFTLYGILFFLTQPGLADAELAWGVVIKQVVPSGLQGLLVVGFFAALMSTVNTLATAASALWVDYLMRRRLLPGRQANFYMRHARISAALVVFCSYLLTRQFTTLVEFIEVVSSLTAFLCIPLYFGIVWRRANRQGMWAALFVGVFLLAATRFWWKLPFVYTVFIPTLSSALVMYLVSRIYRPEDDVLLNRFYCALHTPLGSDNLLRKVGVFLPAMAGAESDPAHPVDASGLAELYREQSSRKVFGPRSSIEILRQPGLDWYYRGFWKILLGCCALLAAAWALGAIMVSLGPVHHAR